MTASLPIRSLHHVARVTSRLDESRAFYRDVLGFREIERPDLRFPGAWLYNYGVQIHLIVDDDRKAPGGHSSDIFGLSHLVPPRQAERRTKKNAFCSFCRKSYRDVGPLVEGPGDVYVCDECIELCQSILEQERRRRGTGKQSGPIETRANHLAFFVDDVDTAQRLLDEHGIAYRLNIQSDTGLKQLFFRDPDGHHVEVATYG